MIKIILKQMWNQRRMNGWIFLELVITGFFLWTMLDPVCILIGNYLIPRGYESEKRYMIRFDRYEDGHGKYTQTEKIDYNGDWEHVVFTLRDLPEVESFTMGEATSIPGSGGFNGMTMYSDSTQYASENYAHCQHYHYFMDHGSDPFKTLGVRDIRTGDYFKPEIYNNGIIITENLAKTMFGTTDVVGKKIIDGSGAENKIAGVAYNVKQNDFLQPYPLTIAGHRLQFDWKHLIYIIKLKKEVDPEAFEERFRNEVVPTLTFNNNYVNQFISLEEMNDIYNESSGVYSEMRLKFILAGFALLCVFLGMLGTFWVRCQSRSGEIGLMCSIGAKRSNIIRQHLTEAALLVGISYLCSMPFILHNAIANGVYTSTLRITDFISPDPQYWQNNLDRHILIVSIVTFIIMLITSLVGTYIPAHRAAQINPADALRDE